MLGVVGIIGCGAMGGAIARALQRHSPVSFRVLVYDVDEGRSGELEREGGVTAVASLSDIVSESDAVVVAVKPGAIVSVFAEISGMDNARNPLYISVAAGVSLERMRQRLGAGFRIIRAMPNTPGLIGEGISAISHEERAVPDDVHLANSILRSLGDVVEVKEELMDAVTALSGSGPAYLFLIIESLIEAGVQHGLSYSVARRLVLSTVVGAGRLMQESGEEAAVLRARVTSPGGTTAAALGELEARDVRGALAAAVSAAANRSRELGMDKEA